MVRYDLEGKAREEFEMLKDTVINLVFDRWGYKVGPHSSGFSEGDKSDECWNYQFVDSKGRPVLLYNFRKENGGYAGILEYSFSHDKDKQFEEAIEDSLSRLAVQQSQKGEF